jgi:hypothetical protein
LSFLSSLKRHERRHQFRTLVVDAGGGGAVTITAVHDDIILSRGEHVDAGVERPVRQAEELAEV